MPFKSEKQRKWMHANEPEMAKDWEKKESLSENKAKLVKNIMQVYKDLDKNFKNYDHTRITNWGKVTRHLTKKFGGNKKLAQHIALSYNSYRGGEDIKKNITKLIKYTQKMTGKKLEATTTSVIPPMDTPKAFKKSTYTAIKIDDEDDSDELIGGIRDYRKKIAKLDKKESVNEGIRVRNGESVKPGMWEVFDNRSGKSIKLVKTASSATRLMNRLMNSGQYKEITTKWVGETVNEDFWALPANWSTQEARLHLDSDIKKMSKILGKASQQVIRIMMNGVKGGRYDALDIVRGIETGPWNRTHDGERPFMKMLWRKVRNGFRRYSKDRKLRK